MIIALAVYKESSVVGEGRAFPKSPIYAAGVTGRQSLLKRADLINISKYVWWGGLT